MMAGPSNDKCINPLVCSNDPPPLSITLKELEDLPNESKCWDKDYPPIDILLLTVEDWEFLACYHYLRDSFKSHEKSIGFVYFGKMGDNEDKSLKVALVKCFKEALHPGGSQTVTKDAIRLLRPKATFLVGFCYSLDPDKAQLGDVVLSSKLTTDFYETPVSKDVGHLVKHAADGWKPPIDSSKGQKIKVHWDGEILSCSHPTGAKWLCESHSEATAVEMEGKGLFAAAHEMKTEWLVIKGVCGFFLRGIASTKDSWKTFACVMAASVLSNILRNSFVFRDWPHYGDGGLKIKVEVDELKPEEQNKQTGMLATESVRCQEVQQPRASATSAASGGVSLPQTEDLHTGTEESFQSLITNLFNATEPASTEELKELFKYASNKRLIIIGVSKGSLVITVKCESLMALEELWKDYSSGHLGKVVQNCFVTEGILKELNLAELRLKTTMDKEEYNACKMFFEKNAVRGVTSESLPKKEQWGKNNQKTKIMETEKSEGTSPLTVVPTTGHGRELEESRGRTDTVPLLLSPTSDPEEELELGELRMELPRMKVMQGVPSDKDLEWLSQKLENWKTVGRRLQIEEVKLMMIDDENTEFIEKIYKMLLHWKERNGSTATYTILHDALCHPLINRTDLAEQLITVKQGVPSDEDLEWLSQKLKKWKTLGRRLKIKEVGLTMIDDENPEFFKKIYKMLLHWKEWYGSTATYTILHDALCHPLVNRTDLAEQLTTGGSTKHLRGPKVKCRDEESSPIALTPKKRRTRLADFTATDHAKLEETYQGATPGNLMQRVPSDEDLDWLSEKLVRWKTLGRRLQIDEESLTIIDDENEKFLQKNFNMLLRWKERNGSTATYTILHDALCHPLMNRTDLAEQLITGGSTEGFRLRGPKVKRRDEESSQSDLTLEKRKTRLAVKQGVPSDEDLEWLSQKLKKWKTLGRRLQIDDGRLAAFDDENRRRSEKIYKMLLHWTGWHGSTATYMILHDALCHPLVNHTDLAEQLITGGFRLLGPKVKRRDEESSLSDLTLEKRKTRLADISTDEESCKSDDPSENKRIRLAEPLNVEKCQEKLKCYYDTFSKVKIVPWDESSSIEINEIYTPLNWMRDHRKPRGVTQEELEDYTDMFKGKPTRMLVYGRPGIGKTTFCKKAAYDWSKALREILMNFCILLLITLRDVCDVENIRDVLRTSKLLASDGPISVDSLYDYIINNQDKVLLILDGYDEYSCAKEHSPILAIWNGEQLSDCHVIVTTCQLECDELRGPSHVQLEIQGFKSWERKRTYARKFLASEQDCDEFMSYLEEKDLYDMAEIPLLLLMLCILWKEKHHEGLAKLRADIFTQFIQTMLDHKGEIQQPMPFQKVTSTEAREDLSNLGKVAFEALLEDRLYVRCSELPDNISTSFQKLCEVGLFQIVNLTSLNPEKGAYFIHKSVQEFLAAWHIKEEVLSIKGETTPSLSKVESFEKIKKMKEVLKFACELSTEAACTVFCHVGSAGNKESLSKCDFMKLLLEGGQLLLEDQELYLELISHSYFCCSAKKRRDLWSVFPSYTGDVLSLESNQLNITVNEHLLKSGLIPGFIFFPSDEEPSEKSYRDLITVAEDTDAVFLSCSGEKKAADLLKKFPRRSLKEFFLKRERKTIVYVYGIWKHRKGDTFPAEMLRELISPTVNSIQVKRVGDPLNEHDNETASCLTKNTDSITGQTPQSLSYVKHIDIVHIERQEMKMLADFLPLFTALRDITIIGKPLEIMDAQLTETLVSHIIFTDRLVTLQLHGVNLAAKPAAAIARSLHQAPSLLVLDLSHNPLGEGVSVLIQHLSCVPHLEDLYFSHVKMTKQQVNDLTAAVRQCNLNWLDTEYHDHKGNVKPEEDWPTDENWRDHRSKLHGSEEESDTDSGDEEEPESCLET